MQSLSQIIAVGICGFSVLLFQNCGSAKHVVPGVLSESSVANPLHLQDIAGTNVGFRVAVDSAGFTTGTQYYWSASYADETYCGQRISNDNFVATFTCTKLGNITVRLAATDVNGKLRSFALPVAVAGTNPPPPPPPPPSPDGAALYATNCASCHQPLAMSSKRGRTRAQLDSAINTVGAMSSRSFLTAAERDAIIQALR